MTIAKWQRHDLLTLVRQRYPDWRGFGTPAFVADELAYKYATIKKAQTLLAQQETKRLLDHGEYDAFLAHLQILGRDNNLLWQVAPKSGDLAILWAPNLAKWAFCEQMRRLLYDQQSSAAKIQTFATYCATHNLPNKWAFVTYFLFITQPQNDIFIKPRTAKWFMRFMGIGHVYSHQPRAEMYEQYQTSCRHLQEALGAKDMVQIQSLIWVAHQESQQRRQRLDVRGQIELERDGLDQSLYQPAGEQSMTTREPNPFYDDYAAQRQALIYTQDDLQRETGLPSQTLQLWTETIERKKQAVFYGPPGTGKTFVAHKVAQYLISGSDGFMETVQFHPAYDYVDFVEGIRPRTTPEGTLIYEMVQGRLLDFCTQAQACTGPCVLIIDELNRANLSRVLGELMYLLEYRTATLQLASGTRFQLPTNVYFLGTMNTADRSIALVDHALRRRFAFIPLYPNFDLLRHYHQQADPTLDVEGLIQLLEQINQTIDDPHYALGISYFLRDDLAHTLPSIWQMEIEPYLEEFFFNRPETVKPFRWQAVAPRLEGK